MWFQTGRSVVSYLIVFSNYINKAFKDHLQVNVIFTDLTKYFDRIDHHILVNILYESGFGGPVICWFKLYLSDKMKYFKVFEHNSNIIEIYLYVSQNGHLSPLIFFTIN